MAGNSPATWKPSDTLGIFFFKAKRSLMLTQKETTEMTNDHGHWKVWHRVAVPAHQPLSGSLEERVGTEPSAVPRAWAWRAE